MKKAVRTLALLAVIAAAAFFYLTRTDPLSAVAAHTPDLANGEKLYTAGGCISCHKPAKDNKTADKSLPSGGMPLHTPAGTFYPPNLTPDPETGIGKWSDVQFVNAMKRGITPDGQHYISAFPFTSYAAMPFGDILDIKAYLMSLKAVNSPAHPHDIPLIWFVRRGFGLWKLAGLDSQTFKPDPAKSASWNRGAYLVNGPGHCSECHTPRNIFMLPDKSRYLAGGPHPEGKGKVPSLRDLIGRKRYKDAKDLVSAFQFGETFGYDKLSSGGMGSVQANLAKLPDADVAAIAEYLTSLK